MRPDRIHSAIILPPATVSLAIVLRRLKAWHVSLFCAAMAMAIASSASAEDSDSIPSWRLGVSQWSGSGYELPAGQTHVPSSPQVADRGNSLPYTMPVDPTANVPTDNSYFELPATNEISSLELTVQPPGQSTDAISPPDTLAPSDSSYSVSPYMENPYPVGSGANTTDPSPLTDAAAIPQLPATEPAPESAPTEESIGDQLTTTKASEPAPLEEEVTRWYQYPRKWIRGWDSHAEFGIDGSNGNADTLALQTGLELKRKTDRYTFAVDVDYRQASSRNVTVEDSGRFNVDYDYLFKESRWAGFSKFGLEWDKFKAFDLRVNVNGGLGYYWIRQDDATLVTRFGAGASKEIGAPVEDWIAEAVFGIEAERQLTSRQKIKGKVDYFPAWEDFSDYRLVTDLAWEVLLDNSENLSLKLAATDRYDSTPQGAEPNDIYYSLLLLYKF